jgi:hypothetical protein
MVLMAAKGMRNDEIGLLGPLDLALLPANFVDLVPRLQANPLPSRPSPPPSRPTAPRLRLVV